MDAPNVFEREMRALEAKFEAKQQELREAGIEKPEREVFRDVVREHAVAGQPSLPPQTLAPAAPPRPAVSVPAATQARLDQFVTHAFTKGIASSIAEARRANDPYLLDLLHDRLADEYYDKLLAARQLNPH